MSLDLVDIKARLRAGIGSAKSGFEFCQHAKGKLNENRNGIFVNLSCISGETGKNYCHYISYVDSGFHLELGENAMDQMKNALRKDDKASPY
jgi:hypothetical protein